MLVYLREDPIGAVELEGDDAFAELAVYRLHAPAFEFNERPVGLSTGRNSHGRAASGGTSSPMADRSPR